MLLTPWKKEMNMKKTNGWLIVAGVVVAAICLSLAPSAGQAAVVDLTTAGSSGTVNGAIFEQIDPQATGSGVIDPFVRVSTNDTIEEGYNTSGRPLEFDENSSPIFTHDLLLSDVPIVDIGGTLYRQFLLDINQTLPGSLLSLDEIQIYQSNTAGLHSGFPAGFGTLVYDLDAGGDNWIKLDYALNSGSGSGDMFAYIPNSLFTGDTYLYFYSLFGENFGNNDGFEEWAVLKGTTQVPEPGTLFLLGSGLFGLALYGRKAFKR